MTGMTEKPGERFFPVDHINTKKWKAASPETGPDWTGRSYFFRLKLRIQAYSSTAFRVLPS
jgi:hypothetical protein